MTTFHYFAYGSNLLAKRIHINNPTAVRYGIGKLKDYRIDFAGFSSGWKGCVATISYCKGSDVWGAIWEINNVNQETLDRQEGVHHGFYKRLNVDVEIDSKKFVRCLVYQQVDTPHFTDDITKLPMEQRPSGVYLEVIKQGAHESKLPDDYIQFLNTIPHNGYFGDVGIKVN